MADDIASVNGLAEKVVGALTDVLKAGTSQEALAAQQQLLQRLATQADVFPSRIPAPRNITEIGGYLNLLGSLNASDTQLQVLSSILGVAGPGTDFPGLPTAPILYDTVLPNDRPGGPLQATIPVEFRIRNDFANAFKAALKTIHDAGCVLPILSPAATLPIAGTPPASVDLLQYLGRTHAIMPNCALNDPDVDPIAVAKLAAGAYQVVARQIDATAPQAASVTAQSWTAWKCTATACTTDAKSRTYLPLTTILNAAGWYQSAVTDPVSLANAGNWSGWRNITGLVPNVTTFGSELRQRFTLSQIAASSLREMMDYTWDGTSFVA
jgi:hypothetical protein